MTAAANQAHIRRRCALAREHGLAPWLMFRGVPGPDQSADYLAADPVNYEGVVFFPGDGDPEMCDENCPRCAAFGKSLWELMIAHANRLHAGLQTAGRAIPLYFGVWNQHLHGGFPNIRKIFDQLAPDVGVCMSISDGWEEQRKTPALNVEPTCPVTAAPVNRGTRLPGRCHGRHRNAGAARRASPWSTSGLMQGGPMCECLRGMVKRKVAYMTPITLGFHRMLVNAGGADSFPRLDAFLPAG